MILYHVSSMLQASVFHLNIAGMGFHLNIAGVEKAITQVFTIAD